MTSQENDSQELHPSPENDPPVFSDDHSSVHSIPDSPELKPLSPRRNHSLSSPPRAAAMISSPPPKSPPSPPLDSSDHTSRSHSYVFSQPEVEQATYQSPPSDYSHAYVISSPSPAAPPEERASQTKDEQLDKSVQDGVGSGRTHNRRPKISISERNRDDLKRKALLGFRILGFLFCLISFSILAADKNQGWAIDSFYRYKEFRYSLSINVMGFAYMGIQSYDLAFCLATGKIVAHNKLRFMLDFSLDQVLAYLLLSASSTAAFRVEDWESNWGKDKFPAMARSSVVLSFLAFVAFSLCSLFSGHTLFTSKFI